MNGIIRVLLTIILDALITLTVVGVICKCFDYAIPLRYALGIWLGQCYLNWLISNFKKN